MATDAHTTWQVVAEGFVLFVVGAAPVTALLEAIGLLTGDPVALEVGLGDGPAPTVAGRPLTEAVVEVVPEGWQAWVLAANTVVAGVFAAGVAWMLYRVLVDARTEPGPFRAGMARRLFEIALVVLLGGLGIAALDNLPNLLLTPDALGMVAHLSLLPVGIAGAIGCIAEVFRRGEAMEHDLAGLV